ncbi:MAG: FG-GAP repeat domain-containing protein [Elusimicrobiota bacterium]
MIFPLSFVFMTALAAAQTADKGYVVRVDSGSVWLDLTAADGAVPGRAFEIYAEGAELKHPVTGASLGRVQNEIAEGAIKDVSDKFSTGEILASKSSVAAGQRVRLTAAPAAPAPKAASRPGEPESRAPKTQGATLPFQINAMAVGDFDKIGKPQLALASENAVFLYAYPMTNGKPLSQMTIPGAGLRILGLEAADLDGDGGDELFVSVYDESFKRFETRVLSMQNGKWLKVADLPFLTRGYQDASGKRVLATQQVLDDTYFPFGALYPLAYQDGRYVQGRPALKLRRVDWLFEFTTAQIGAGDPAVLYLTNTHHLRVQFGKEYWPTPDDDYGQTPLRVRWHDRLLEFNPPMVITYLSSGFDSLYAVRNMAALGGLASPFGVFNHAELVGKRWNGLGLETAWKADLSGCAQGLALVEISGHKEIAVAVRGTAGQSSVWTFDP